ncbi:hypothetical protein BS78_02G378300 [Paspalum vaginatum]|nr:hypothetical protein BS78_02G378300 [Paspalum vaginatum]
MANRKTMFSYYKKKEQADVAREVQPISVTQAVDAAQEVEPTPESNVHEVPHLEPILVSDPQVDSREHQCVDAQEFIQDCPVDKQYEIRKAYMKLGPYQPIKDVYPSSGPKSHPRRFQSHWFKSFSWLEYSSSKDAAFCFPCFLFRKKPTGKSGSTTFTVKGFRSWRKVNNGAECAFLSHMGKDSNSAHYFAVQCYDNLMSGKLRLKTSIDVVKWLAFQACSFRGNDEGPNSKNQGNFREMVKLLALYNEEVKAVVLDNAPGNAKYISPDIQKEILHIIVTNVQMSIRKEIGDAKFCLLVDEARDESKREQMALRFLDLIHVPDTTATTLKQELCSVLSDQRLDVQNIRGQVYDGASNMRGEWNGLQRKFSEDCPYAYYVHCFAHQLQLVLVAASKEVTEVHNFFEHLAVVVNVVASSCKRNDELRANQVVEIQKLVELNELETGTGANQIGALQRPCETRWSSHFSSICSLLKLYKAAFLVLKDITSSKGPGTSPSARAKSAGAVKLTMSFDFVFILHLMKELMEITYLLCKKLQQKSQDIVNAMHDVATTKILIQKLRDDGWSGLLSDVVSFCKNLEILVPDMRSFYVDYIRSRREDETSVGHHYQYDVFTVAVDQQLQELNNRFSEQTTELLILCNSLDPRDSFKSLKLDDVCLLAIKLIRLILTLPVSTATTERAFSAMKLVKTRLRNKMEDEYLRDCLLIYIEKEEALEFAIDTLIDDFSAKKRRRVDLK